MNSMDIQKIPTGKLNPAKYNPRFDLKPGDTEYEKLLRSVEEFGYVEPIIWEQAHRTYCWRSLAFQSADTTWLHGD